MGALHGGFDSFWAIVYKSQVYSLKLKADVTVKEGARFQGSHKNIFYY